MIFNNIEYGGGSACTRAPLLVRRYKMKCNGEILKDYRIKNNLKQSELAKMYNITESAISQYETNKRDCAWLLIEIQKNGGVIDV